LAAPYTDKQLLQALCDLAAELSRPPTARELAARRDLPTSPTYLSRFGSWNAALEAAGLKPNRRSNYTDERLIEILRDLADELGRLPTCREMRARRDLPDPTTYIRRFGNWRNALARLGTETRTDSAHHTDADLLDALRGLADELGRPPAVQELLARPDLPTPGAYVHRFGDWSNALEAAGLDASYRRPPAYTDADLLDALRGLAAELDRTPTGRELLARRDLPSPSICQIRFGSWNKALEAAGLEPKRRRRSPGLDEGETR